VVADKPELCEKEAYKELASYQYLGRHLTNCCDGDAQTLPHRAFLAVPLETKAHWNGDEQFIDAFSDLKKLKEYLKDCFALLYRYEMLLLECGLTPKWDEEVADALWRLFNVRTELSEKEDGEGYTLKFV
jgi:hypothetical protein